MPGWLININPASEAKVTWWDTRDKGINFKDTENFIRHHFLPALLNETHVSLYNETHLYAINVFDTVQ